MADRQQLIDYLRSSQPKGLERFAVEDAPDDRFVEDLLALREGVTQDRMAREEATRRQDPNVQIRELLDVGLGGNQQMATPEDVTQEPGGQSGADLMQMLTTRGQRLTLGPNDELPEDFGSTFSKGAPGSADRANQAYARLLDWAQGINARASAENTTRKLDDDVRDMMRTANDARLPKNIREQALESIPGLRQQSVTASGVLADLEKNKQLLSGKEKLALVESAQKQREAQDEAIGKVFSDFLKRKGQADEDPSSTKSILSQLPEDMRKQLINRPDRDAILKSFRDTKLMEESLGLVDPETQAALKELPQFKAVLGSLTSRVSELDKKTPAAAGATATDSGMSAGEMLMALALAAGGVKGASVLKNRKAAQAATKSAAPDAAQAIAEIQERVIKGVKSPGRVIRQ